MMVVWNIVVAMKKTEEVRLRIYFGDRIELAGKLNGAR